MDIFWLTLLSSYGNHSGPTISAPSGLYLGWESLSRDGRPYEAWTNIPFAQPPIGKLRFKPPMPLTKPYSVYNCTQDPPMCNQDDDSGQEDCLYLNVYRPKVRNDSLPVLVYVHGGAYQHGSIGPRENAEFLMHEDVVLVSFNYRVNGFGFMSLGDTVMPGNFGMKDQVMALKWVKRNIAAFGGDPDSITIFGGSAGGTSTHLLLNSPSAQDLITRAVSHSGSISKYISILNTTRVVQGTVQVAELVGCPHTSSEDTLHCLQQVNASDLLTAINNISRLISIDDPFVLLTFTPTIEPEDAEQAVVTYDLSSQPSDKPWITSFSNGEYLLFRNLLKQNFYPNELSEIRDNVENVLKKFTLEFTDNPVNSANNSKLLEELYFSNIQPTDDAFIDGIAMTNQDSTFIFPAIHNIKRHSGPKWLSHFEYKGPISRSTDPITGQIYPDQAAGHSPEKYFYFNMHPEIPLTASDYLMSKQVIRFLVDFAYYGQPTPPGSPVEWKEYRTNEMLRITNNGIFPADNSFYNKFEEIYNIWQKITAWNS